MRIAYNSAAFGSNIVANKKITVTKGSNFNSTTYIEPGLNIIDQTDNTLGLPFNTDYHQSNYNRTQLLTTDQQLVHIKIEIANCGQNSNLDFVDTDITSNLSLYTPAANSSINDINGYSATYYQKPENMLLLCQIKINDFNSPINGGVGQILSIKGNNFGNNRGNGQVKFRDANRFGFPYIQKLDDADYISWSNELIQIRMPSSVLTTISSGIINQTPGTGNFIVKNNNGDSVISNNNTSGKPFTVYYSLSTRVMNTKKHQAYIKKSNANGGYTVRLDTSISNYHDRLACAKLAIKQWRCYTAMNFEIGTDTLIPNPKSDGVCTLFFSDNLLPNALAQTQNQHLFCAANSDTIFAIKEFDITVRRVPNMFYDVDGKKLPIGKFDFYETLLHELGHAFGLQHLIDTTQLMYYRTNYSFTNDVQGYQRRTLKPYSADAEGGTYQVSRSIGAVKGQCQDFLAVIPAQNTSCGSSAINELLANNFFIKAYPNPIADNNLTISFEAPKNMDAQLIIYDVVGRVMYKQYVNNRVDVVYSHNVDVSAFAAGIYFVKLLVGTNNVSTKFIRN
jgi:hypothetical protein